MTSDTNEWYELYTKYISFGKMTLREMLDNTGYELTHYFQYGKCVKCGAIKQWIVSVSDMSSDKFLCNGVKQ
jgi:hypothetical protein